MAHVSKYVVIHGHYYQPPRENAWTELVERQPSAQPFHDWNERITSECYASNARARVLGDRDHIVDIVNNFARTSFNVGPTLLSWLEAHSPRTYEAILEADRESRTRFSGHGSAMAQAYSHMILPLASARDKATQVRWGVRDFEHRFGRKPEGMWLAETAVDTDSLEALAAEGILFTVLSPRQAKSVRGPADEKATPVADGTVDTRRAYRVDLPSKKSIVVFFYDGARSQAVAFERLLADGASFARRLLEGFRDDDTPELVHIATDGETYGHHHRFGEMALAWATMAIERAPDVRLTNYAEYLSLHPPDHVAEIVERSSWSCFHGVGRWSEDCGCRFRVESSQAWRKPLRVALDRLRARLDDVYEAESASLFRDPWAARDAYIDVVLDRSDEAAARFIGEQASRQLSPEETTRALSLSEMQRHAMLMFTSCGWFFDDVTGIETEQILEYAVRAADLAESLAGVRVLDDFLAALGPARGVLPGSKSAQEVVVDRVLPARVDLIRVGMHHAVFAALRVPRPFTTGAHTITSLSERLEIGMTAGGPTLAVGRVEVRHRLTSERVTLAFVLAHLGMQSISGAIGRWDDAAAFEVFSDEVVRLFRLGGVAPVAELARSKLTSRIDSLAVLWVDEHQRIFNALTAETLDRVDRAFRQIHDDCAPLLRYVAHTPFDPPRQLRTASRLVLGSDVARELRREAPNLERLESLLAEARSVDVRLDNEELSMLATRLVERVADRVEEQPGDAAFVELGRAVDLCRSFGRQPDLTRAQDLVWAIGRAESPPGGPVFADLARRLHLDLAAKARSAPALSP